MTARLNIPVLAAGEFTVTAGLTMVVPFLPFYLADLGLPPQERQLWAGVALVAPAVTLAAASPWWGRTGDRTGRKWMVVRALGGIALSLLVMAAARTPVVFVLGRLAQGALGGVTDAAAAFAGAEAGEAVRGRALGRLHSATAAGALVGPLSAGLLAGRTGYRPLFVGAAAMSLLTAGLAAVLLREHAGGAADHRTGRVDRWAMARLARGPHGRTHLVAGIVTTAAVYGLVVVFAPHVATLVAGESAATRWVGILQAITWAAAIGGGIWWGRRNDTHPSARNLVTAAGLCGLAVAAQGVPVPVGVLLPLRAVQGFAFAAVTPCVFLHASRVATPAEEGRHVGMANSLLVTGRVAGGLAGGLISSALPTGVAVGLLGGTALLGAGASFLLAGSSWTRRVA